MKPISSAKYSEIFSNIDHKILESAGILVGKG